MKSQGWMVGNRPEHITASSKRAMVRTSNLHKDHCFSFHWPFILSFVPLFNARSLLFVGRKARSANERALTIRRDLLDRPITMREDMMYRHERSRDTRSFCRKEQGDGIFPSSLGTKEVAHLRDSSRVVGRRRMMQVEYRCLERV
jgi:hypothetical protein